MRKKADKSDYVQDNTDMSARSRKGGRGGRAVATLGFLAAMTAVMYLTAVICVWINERAGENTRDDGGGKAVVRETPRPGVISASSDGVVYSQEELESRLSASVEEAQRKAVDQVLDSIKSSLDAGDSLLQALRPLYPDEIVVYSGDKYHFVPINRELKMNDYTNENVNVLESGEIQYMRDGQVISHKGIDVSQYQENIDWKKVAGDGVEFAFIRAGYRGWGSSGKLVADSNFDTNMKNALANGIKVGVYFVSQAISGEEAVEEANFVLEKIAPYQVECPIVLDVETVSDPNGRMNNISLEERTNYVLTFCQTIEGAGYRPMLYYNTEMGAVKLDVATLENYGKWFASYSEQLYYPYAYEVWQYSSKGSVAGIRGAVDLNISFEPIWE